jgi:hypothetical protein
MVDSQPDRAFLISPSGDKIITFEDLRGAFMLLIRAIWSNRPQQGRQDRNTDGQWVIYHAIVRRYDGLRLRTAPELINCHLL